MSNQEQEKTGATSSSYDIADFLKYSGPSLQQREPIADGIALLGYRNTGQNERNISILLSSQGIPFNLQRPQHGWSETNTRITVVVPQSQYQKTLALLNAAAGKNAIEIVEGDKGLISY